ncbi:CBS domain-containing protein [Actinacidiphila oryziradicis]|uniref:CBS domain-containing protein n=1 Tax=Actinacidiphila oryziradicis TaxID=2571141 RepID=A0A4U0RTY5_9ACTN|nr:CBS domain-containing protein [Actinacidiphila oryziradicis]TJZ99569.1 CBS domain-containing protein [Actinacidiphila oryziradicis]
MKHQMTGTVMTSDVIRTVADTPFKDVAALLAQHHISGLPVVDDDDKVIGVISETDLLLHHADQEKAGAERRFHLTPAARRTATKAHARTAGELMSTPAITVRADDSIANAARTMAQHRVERLPVLDEEDRLVGIVTRRDLLQVFLRTDPDIRTEVIDEILVRTLWLSPYAIGVTVTDGVVTLEGRLERKSDVSITAQMTSQVDGVVAVVNHLTYRFDDADLRPAEPAVHGVADSWLRKL